LTAAEMNRVQNPLHGLENVLPGADSPDIMNVLVIVHRNMIVPLAAPFPVSGDFISFELSRILQISLQDTF